MSLSVTFVKAADGVSRIAEPQRLHGADASLINNQRMRDVAESVQPLLATLATLRALDLQYRGHQAGAKAYTFTLTGVDFQYYDAVQISDERPLTVIRDILHPAAGTARPTLVIKYGGDFPFAPIERNGAHIQVDEGTYKIPFFHIDVSKLTPRCDPVLMTSRPAMMATWSDGLWSVRHFTDRSGAAGSYRETKAVKDLDARGLAIAFDRWLQVAAPHKSGSYDSEIKALMASYPETPSAPSASPGLRARVVTALQRASGLARSGPGTTPA